MSRAILTLVLALGLVAAACSDDGSGGADGPTVVVTTSVLGDVVEHLVAADVDVVTIMPPGTDPHVFQASARQVARIQEADVLVVNGGGFEQGLVDVVDGARRDGVPTFTALDAVEPLGNDPHFFTDPVRMAEAASALVDFLADELPGAVGDRAAGYLDDLSALDREVTEILAVIPPDDRLLATDHEVFAYFADRYDFDVLGVVIPGGGTGDAVDSAALDELARSVEAAGVPAVFASSTTHDLVQTLAQEAGGIEVVDLFGESLGPADSPGGTYVGMQRTNAERIAAALGRPGS